MSKIFGSILETIGGTPLVEVKGFGEGGARVLAKVEYFNPGGSVKDRIALSMIDDAEKRGLLLPGGTIIEPTSGSLLESAEAAAHARGEDDKSRLSHNKHLCVHRNLKMQKHFRTKNITQLSI